MKNETTTPENDLVGSANLVGCKTCEHYRHTPNTQIRITIGLGSIIAGELEKHECLLMPQPIEVSPDHKCGQHTPNDTYHFRETIKGV